jgi:hypothetical protein
VEENKIRQPQSDREEEIFAEQTEISVKILKTKTTTNQGVSTIGLTKSCKLNSKIEYLCTDKNEPNLQDDYRPTRQVLRTRRHGFKQCPGDQPYHQAASNQQISQLVSDSSS